MATKDLGIVTAYGYAVAGGYTGTEQEFTALLGDLALTVEDLENMTVSVTTLEPNQQATASYADGVLSLGIPKGVAGEVQFSDLEPLAEKDGNYENLTAGSALQFISDKYTENKEPYLFRKSIAGDRELDTLVGGSVAWNQKRTIPSTATTTINGVTFTNNDDGTIKVNGTATADATFDLGVITGLTAGKYLLRGCPAGGNVNTYYLGNVSQFDVGNGYMFAMNSPSGNGNRIYVKSGATLNNLVFKPQLFNLTQMFGSSVADYIYAMEQANAGSGVALFRSWFPKDYYAYNEGTLMSVKTSAHEMVGFNQWDEEWRNGYYDSTGAFVANSAYVANKNPIPVLPNTAYYGAEGSNFIDEFHCYDSSINYLGIATRNADGTRTTLNGTAYINFRTRQAYGTTYKNDICVNLSSDRNGEYQPYVKHTYPLDDIELRGVAKLNGTDIYFDGDTYESDGTVTRRYGIVDLGTLNWNKQTELGVYFGVLSSGFGGKPTPSVSSMPNIVSAKFKVAIPYDTYDNQVDKTISVYTNGSLIIRDSAYSDLTAAAFKTAMSGVYLVYELATPTTETADPFTSPQIVDAYGTERYVDERTVAVPVGHDTKYPDNLREKLDGLPWDFSSLIAPTEKAYTATRNYTTGALLIVNNTLYKVTANIANGGAITPNTNVTATTLAEVISAL